MLLIREDGSGKPDANSYATALEGDAYHEGHLYAADWSATLAERKEAALIMATRLIDAFFRFRGERAGSSQALQWPRSKVVDACGESVAADVVPDAVRDAAIETARELIKADRTATPEGEGLEKLVFFNNKSTTYNPADRRPVIPLVAQMMLSRLGSYAEARSAAVPLERA
jgi:hypothetical protein